VVRNVPALVSAQCEEDGIADEVVAYTEEVIVDARKKRFPVEVTSLSWSREPTQFFLARVDLFQYCNICTSGVFLRGFVNYR
jgi:hypothetical protein